MDEKRGELTKREPHPAALQAQQYLETLTYTEGQRWLDSFRSHATGKFEGDAVSKRLSEVLASSLERMLDGEAISDTEILGLAYTIRTADL